LCKVPTISFRFLSITRTISPSRLLPRRDGIKTASTVSPLKDVFRFFPATKMSFICLSLSKTKNMPYKEWQGETKNDEIVIVNYKEGVVIIGAGYNEIKARQNMFALCETRDKLGFLRHDNRIDIYNVNDLLKLEWVFPEGYLEE